MKINVTYLALLATALTVGCSSCTSEQSSLIPQNEGRETSFSLTIGGPSTYADAHASATEVALNSVDIFVYKTGGALESHTRKEFSVFQQVGTADSWKLKESENIVSTTGSKTIYVGVNLPQDIADKIKTDGPATDVTITKIADLKSDGFAMFCTKAAETTLEFDETKNEVVVDISRLVAKVVFYGSSTYDVESGGTIKDLAFTTGNVNNKFYPLPYENFSDPNFTSSIETADFLHPTQDVDSYQLINAKSITLANARGVYATENTVAEGAIQGALTYGIIKGTYIPATTVSLSNPADGHSALVTSKPTTAATFYLVRVHSEGVISSYFFTNKSHAETFAVANEYPSSSVATYTNGVMYYSVFLKDTKQGTASEYSIFRNTIYSVTVTAVRKIGSNSDQPISSSSSLIPALITPSAVPVVEGDELSIATDVLIVDWTGGSDQDEVLQGN